ncbi:MAG: glycosyltransferase family 39 protein [Caldilineaceae bacterium]|nr:glycosyltransferase family 39 protein [Caldilineaceae bacterium]
MLTTKETDPVRTRLRDPRLNEPAALPVPPQKIGPVATPRMGWPYSLGLVILLGTSFTLALQLLNRFPLREDEALYSFWALHFWHSDPWFLTVWPDKPPLFLWLLSAVFQLWGASQASGRLLNIMLTLLTALVVGATARHLWGRRRAWVATLLYLLNPFVLSFAPTVYTDPLLVLLGQLALFFAVTGRSWGAGIWLALAIMTKQQGVFYLPLVVGVLYAANRPGQPAAGWPGQTPSRKPIWFWLRFALGLLLVLGPLIYGDSLRWAVAPSPWDLAGRNYGGLSLAPVQSWPTRLAAWAQLLWYFTASWPLWLLSVAVVGSGWWRQRHAAVGQGPGARVAYWLLGWLVGFLLLHSLTTIQIWDRYLLPLVPLFCLLLAWLVPDKPWCWPTPLWGRVAATGLVALALLPPALTAAAGRLPIGSDHGAYGGLPAAMAWLAAQAPAQSVLYHQQLGWHYQFYLYPQLAAGRYELRWFPTATYLAADAARLPNRPRFLIQPDWAPQPSLALRLAMQNIRLRPMARFDQMTIYQLQSNMRTPCDWCLCQRPSRWPSWISRDLTGEIAHP